MILRPLEPLTPTSRDFVSAWDAVQRIQTKKYESFWLITQPSHAALAAELAANICAPQFPAANAQLLQAIALHDAGWGIPDAQAIMKSRSVHPRPPDSFLATLVLQFLKAWEKSIEICESVSPAGGYVVSRHFYRLAEHRLQATEEANKQEQSMLESFLKSEERRQKKLAAKQALSMQQLEGLTDLLQFCDLLSLYLCSGALEKVAFPEYFGVELRVTNDANTYKLDPPVVKSGSQFAVAALRYPATKEESSREIRIKIE